MPSSKKRKRSRKASSTTKVKEAKRSRKALPATKAKEALKRIPLRDLLNEISQRGQIRKGAQANTPPPLARSQQRRLHSPGQQAHEDIEAQVKAARDKTAKHYEYLGELFELLHKEQMDRLCALGIQRRDTTAEFAKLGRLTVKSMFDHLIAANQEFLDAGTFDIRSIWSYLTSDKGYAFASGMVRRDRAMPPNLGKSFIHQTVRNAVTTLLDIAEEDRDEG